MQNWLCTLITAKRRCEDRRERNEAPDKAKRENNMVCFKSITHPSYGLSSPPPQLVLLLGQNLHKSSVAESLFRATLSIFGTTRQLSAAQKIISCLRASGARVLMIKRNEAGVPKMVTEQGKWLDGEAICF